MNSLKQRDFTKKVDKIRMKEKKERHRKEQLIRNKKQEKKLLWMDLMG
jgi:hypothetical protein